MRQAAELIGLATIVVALWMVYVPLAVGVAGAVIVIAANVWGTSAEEGSPDANTTD